MPGAPEHNERIVDQFTQQAVPFSNAPAIAHERGLQLLVSASGATAQDRVLDVACGPGLVVRAFAAVADHVTGIDVTPAMLSRSRELTAGCPNVTLAHGDVTTLPYPDATFSIVVSRFAFHHFQEPHVVLAEMRRVCRPGGRVVVCDLLASDDPQKASAFHAMEIVRDPSHARALTLAELISLFSKVGLPTPATTFYEMPFDLESLLSRSFPAPGQLETVRAAYVASLDNDGLGLATQRVGNEIRAAYRVSILTAER